MNHCAFMMACLLFICCSSVVSANFVCGEVLHDDDISPVWMQVQVHYAERPLDTISCMVSGERKYCCDLDAITSVVWKPNKTVIARVDDTGLGYVSNTVSLVTSEEAYDVFPKLHLGQPFTFSEQPTLVMVNTTTQLFTLTLHPLFDSLRVKLFHEGSMVEYDICHDCETVTFPLNFSSGTTIVSFVASGEIDFVVNYTFFVLDYLVVNYSFSCDSCASDGTATSIPASTLVNLTLTVNASHPLTLDMQTYIPQDWFFTDERGLVAFSASHDYVLTSLENQSFLSILYQLHTPSIIIQRQYSFLTLIDTISTAHDTYITRPFWLGLPLYLRESFSNATLYTFGGKQFASPGHPFILPTNESDLMLVAIYPTRPGLFEVSLEITEPFFFFDSDTEYRLLSNFADAHIDRIYVQFRVQKDEVLTLSQGGTFVLLEQYLEDETFLYYRGYLRSKDTFYVSKTT